ncbi:MAG TPA: hypothetical protein VIG64_10725 [Actinomycetota bacterium]
MTVAFLVALAAAWIAVFLPAIRRARQTTPLSTSERWRRRMELIAPRHAASRTRGRWVVVPESRKSLARDSWRRGQRTRRRIFELMIGAVIGSLVAALLWDTDNAWLVQAGCDLSLALYVSLLVEAKRRRQQRFVRMRRRTRRRAVRPMPRVAWATPPRQVDPWATARAGVTRR